MAKNANLHTAKSEKNDEFYTRYEDIEKEVMNYREQFEGKVVLCNCDDPARSNFWQFFHQNFFLFKLKKLISTHYKKEGSSYTQIFDGKKDNIVPLTRDEQNANAEDYNLFEMCSLVSNGDFRSEECLKYLEEADIVVTNPPFSLFREFIDTLEKYGKKYLVVGNFNAVTYKEVFPLIKENKIWLGYNWVKEFIKPDGGTQEFGNICWFTNLDTKKRHEDIILWREYNKKDYPKYDNYDAINVDKVTDIPCDYYGVMGVPITFLDKHNPEQFEVVGIAAGNSWANYREILESLNFDPTIKYGGGLGSGVINGNGVYARILIRRIVK